MLEGFKNISIVNSLRVEYESSNTIPTFLEFVQDRTELPVVPPEVATDLRSEKYCFGSYENGWIEFDENSKKVIDVIQRKKLISLKQATITTGVRDLGVFTVESNAMRFSDPCYDNDVWCKGSMPAVNGKWQARLGFFRDPYEAHHLICRIAYIQKAMHILKDVATHQAYDVLKEAYRLAEAAKQKVAYTDISFPTELSALITDLAEFAKPLYEWDWVEPEVWATRVIENVLSLVIGDSYDLEKFRWSRRIIDYELRLSKKEITDQEYFLKTKTALLETLNQSLEHCQKAYDSGLPRRVQFLHIKHESIPEFTSFEQEAWIAQEVFQVGVDSGQAGFFDEAWYAGEHNGEKHYEMLCNLSIGEIKVDPETGERGEYNFGGTFKNGCNSMTAHGDGSAPLFYRTDADGNVIEAVYHYDLAWKEDEVEELEETSDSGA
ncbi:DUF4241 domain-containing protein [Acinetobacter baumannii]|nr:DUF4241 domain-containing protein [Acinetobacter baumannii]